jgi:hypothetical protein
MSASHVRDTVSCGAAEGIRGRHPDNTSIFLAVIGSSVFLRCMNDMQA